jgi:hypothetical protein
LRDQALACGSEQLSIDRGFFSIADLQPVRAFGRPAIFVAGGLLAITVASLLVLFPNAAVGRRKDSRKDPGASVCRDGPACTTLLLWSMNRLSILVIHFIMLWMPAILHSTGGSQARSILRLRCIHWER